MRILLAMMIPNPFARPITAWITVFVILLHGVTVWAMVSMDSPPPLTDTSSANAIEVEFITLSSQPKKPPQPKESISTDMQPKTATTKPAQPNAPTMQSPSIERQPIETISTEALAPTQPLSVAKTPETSETETLEVESSMPKSSTPEPFIHHIQQQQQQQNKNILSSEESAKKNMPPDTSSSVANLTIVESKKVAKTSKQANQAEAEEEDYLSYMIRAVTEKYNREQAVQKQAAAKRANRKRNEQAQWQEQAANETVRKMLALAAAQAEEQTMDRSASDNDASQAIDETVFLAEYGSWIEGQEPITSIPSLVWRSVDRELGDVFIVMLELHVDTAGSITEVQLLESSGSPIIDAIATTQVRAGQLNPIQQNDVAVDAIVPMSLVYERAKR